MKIKSILYFFLAATSIGAELMNLIWIHGFSKALLMPVLIWIVWQENVSKKLKISLSIALLFSLFGDVLLLQSGEEFFLFGLLAFLLAHLTYLFIFKDAVIFKWPRVLPVLAFLALFCFGVLWGNLTEEMRYPVYVYMLVIGLMGMLASMRNVNDASFETVLIGAVLFIISDAFIAVDQFVQAIPLSSFWILSTYALAQHFLVTGLLLEKSE